MTPTTPRQKLRFAQPTIRRHSFATRQQSPSFSPQPDQEDSARTPRSYIDEMDESPRERRLASPSKSVRSNAGSVASGSSTQPPVQSMYRTTVRH